MQNNIKVKKAAQHNLKKIDVCLPRNSFVVVTGPSGSGKSSFAFDTLFAEGQRRYIECLSTYARQYIEQMEKPDVESMEGLSPAISIDQRTISTNPRSTIGTVTEIYDYLRLLFSKAGIPHCPNCGRQVRSQTREQMIKRLIDLAKGKSVKIYSPLIKGRKGEYLRLFDGLRKKGFLRVRVNSQIISLDEEIVLEKNKKNNIEVLIDELKIEKSSEKRLVEAVSLALEMSKGDLLIVVESKEETYFSLSLLCPFCNISLPELEPRSFSFNSPYGACRECNGIGFKTQTNSLGVVKLTGDTCNSCGGSRLKKESLSVKIGKMNIHDLCILPVHSLNEYLRTINFNPYLYPVTNPILKEINSRLDVMIELGMPYLQLSRTTSSLSGGEARRIRLAAQVGARLRGILYVLDEPTIGLHQRDNGRLISLLREIRDEGNSVVVVEHDEQTIRSADFVLDLGPGAGENGGMIVAEGDLNTILQSSKSLTAQYLNGNKIIPVPLKRRISKGKIKITGASQHNLKNIEVSIPLGVITVVTGVSGSGKSTLIYDTLYRYLSKELYGSMHKPGKFKDISGIDLIDKVVSVNQKPIGRTPRSNPATYTGLFGSLRQLFSMTRESRARGYKPGRFSFNVSGGRCEECHGAGVKRIEMHFLPDVFVTCDSCSGQRYNKETLEVQYKGKNIADFLEMTINEAIEYLKAQPYINRKLELLKKVGLGYLRLGQPAPTLSGGEAQRIKLTKELSRRNTGNTLYLLDEPTTGLHFDDVRKLLSVLSELVELGNSVVIIEHNLEVIKYSDYVIDLGPEGGEKGGYVVAKGTPEQVAHIVESYTGKYLKEVLFSGGLSVKSF